MNLDELRSVQSKERQKDSLQHLRDSFYEDVGEYIAELKDQRDSTAAVADDPFSNPDVGRLTDEIETAEEVVEAIYERRMGKIVKRASLAAAGMPADEEGLTTEEKELFGDIVGRIETNKTHVLDVLSGDTSAGSPEADTAGATAPDHAETEATADTERSADPDDGVSAADLMGEGTETDPTPASVDDGSASDGPPVDAESGVPDAIADAERERAQSSDARADDDTAAETPVEPRDGQSSTGDGADGPESSAVAASAEGDASATPQAESTDAGSESDRATVRITQDVGQILGIDEREYDLAAEDVVRLPEQNAEPLVQRDAAERLD